MTPAEIAARELQERRAYARGLVDGGDLTAQQAEAKLLPWFHIACMAGSDLPECYEEGRIVAPLARAGQTMRTPVAWNLTEEERRAARNALAIARDDAIDAAEQDRGERKKHDRAIGLMRLAEHLRAPPYGYREDPPAKQSRAQVAGGDSAREIAA